MRPAQWAILAAVVACGCARPSLSHPSGAPNPAQVSSVEGMVYTVDEHELRLYTSGAALRFPLGPQARQLLWKGKPVTDLRPGERVRLDVHMAADGQAMQVDAFEVLAGAPRSQHNPHEAHAASPLSPTPQATEEPATTKKGDQP